MERNNQLIQSNEGSYQIALGKINTRSNCFNLPGNDTVRFSHALKVQLIRLQDFLGLSGNGTSLTFRLTPERTLAVESIETGTPQAQSKLNQLLAENVAALSKYAHATDVQNGDVSSSRIVGSHQFAHDQACALLGLLPAAKAERTPA